MGWAKPSGERFTDKSPLQLGIGSELSPEISVPDGHLILTFDALKKIASIADLRFTRV